MLGNQCPLQGQRTLCCVQTRSGAWHSWVQCSSHMCSGPNNVATSFIAADTEDFDTEDSDMSTYEDRFEQQQQQQQQQLEQNDRTTKRSSGSVTLGMISVGSGAIDCLQYDDDRVGCAKYSQDCHWFPANIMFPNLVSEGYCRNITW